METTKIKGVSQKAKESDKKEKKKKLVLWLPSRRAGANLLSFLSLFYFQMINPTKNLN